MSEELRPNVNAVGLVADAFKSIEKHIRGKAKEDIGRSLIVCSPLITEFAEKVSDLLDEEYGK